MKLPEQNPRKKQEILREGEREPEKRLRRVGLYSRNLSVKYLLTYYYSPDHLLLRATFARFPLTRPVGGRCGRLPSRFGDRRRGREPLPAGTLSARPNPGKIYVSAAPEVRHKLPFTGTICLSFDDVPSSHPPCKFLFFARSLHGPCDHRPSDVAFLW